MVVNVASGSGFGRPVTISSATIINPSPIHIESYLETSAGLDRLEYGSNISSITALTPILAQGVAAVEPLLQICADPNTRIRPGILIVLVHLGKPAIPLLTKAVDAKNPRKALCSLAVLDELGQSAETATLAVSKFVDVTTGTLKAGAAITLSRISRTKKTEQKIIALLRDPDPSVRYYAAVALGEYKDRLSKDAVAGLIKTLWEDPDEAGSFGATYALSLVGEIALSKLIQGTRQPAPKTRRRSLDAIGLMKPPLHHIQGVLNQALKDIAPEVRYKAAAILASYGYAHADILAALAEALKHEDPILRWEAVEALAALGPMASAVKPALVRAFKKSSSRPFREKVALALSRLGDVPKELVRDLERMLAPSGGGCFAATAALGEVRSDKKKAVKALERGIAHPHAFSIFDNMLAFDSLQALKKLAPQMQYVSSTTLAIIDRSSAAIAAIVDGPLGLNSDDEDVVFQKITMMRPPSDPEHRLIESLGPRHRRLVPRLIRSRRMDWRASKFSLHSHNLSKMGPVLVPVLGEILRDRPLQSDRDMALGTLAFLGEDAVAILPILMRQAKDERAWDMIGRLGAIIVNMGDAVIPILAEAFKSSPEAAVRIAKVFSTIGLGGTRLNQRLIAAHIKSALSTKDEEVLLTTLSVLESFGKNAKNALPALTRLLKQSTGVVRYSAAKSILKISGRSPLPVRELATQFAQSSGQQKIDMADALGSLGGQARAAVPAMLSALESPGNELRHAAARAIVKISPDMTNFLLVRSTDPYARNGILSAQAERVKLPKASLLSSASAQNPVLRFAALRALAGKIHQGERENLVLMSLMVDPEPAIQLEFLNIRGFEFFRIEGPTLKGKAFPLLIKGFSAYHPQTRRMCVMLLQHFKEDEHLAAPELAKLLLTDPDPEVRSAVVAHFWTQSRAASEETLLALLKAKKDPSSFVQAGSEAALFQVASRLLSRLDQGEPIGPLFKLLALLWDDKPLVRPAIEQRLKADGFEKRKPAIEAVIQSVPQALPLAIASLVEVVQSSATTEENRKEAIKMLEAVGTAEARQALNDVLQEPIEAEMAGVIPQDISEAAFFASSAARAGAPGPGYTMSFSIPFGSDASNNSPTENIRIEVSSAPEWTTLLRTSNLGPLPMLPPGEKMVFRADFVINDKFNEKNLSEAAEIVVEVKTDTKNLNAPHFFWHFRTSNGFKTSSGECLDHAGGSYGGYVSPDQEPPVTNLVLTGEYEISSSAGIQLSTNTEIMFEANDILVSDAVTSDIKETFYSVDQDQQPGSSASMTPFTRAFLLPVGQHRLYFYSIDNAGNIESTNCIVLRVIHRNFLKNPGPQTLAPRHISQNPTWKCPSVVAETVSLDQARASFDARHLRLRWKQETGCSFECKSIILGDTLYAAGRGGVSAFDLLKGTKKWTYPAEIPGFSEPDTREAPKIYENHLYFDVAFHGVYCVTLDGKPVWHRPDGLVSRLEIVDGIAWFVLRPCGHLNVLDAASGKVLWAYQCEKNETVTNPAVFLDGYFYMTTSLNPRLFRIPVKPKSKDLEIVYPDGPISHLDVREGNLIFQISTSGAWIGYDPRQRKEVWRSTIPAVEQERESLKLDYRAKRIKYYRAAKPEWEQDIGLARYGNARILGQVGVVASQDILHLLDLSGGNIVNTYLLDADAFISLVDSHAIVIHTQKSLYFFDDRGPEMSNEGSVVDGRVVFEGAPVPNIDIWGGLWHARSDSDGRYSLRIGASGDLNLTARNDQYTCWSNPFKVEPGGRYLQDIICQPILSGEEEP